MINKKQVSETFHLGMILALAGGFLDAYTYILRGQVFANAQTGNIVLLGIHLARKEVVFALQYFIPILAFTLGVVISEYIRFLSKNQKIHWRQIILLIEIIILAGTVLIPIGRQYDIYANVLVSFVCSLQVQSFRKMEGKAYATTMCTGNLRSASERIYHGLIEKNKKLVSDGLQYLGIIGCFVVGAALGAVLSGIWGIYSMIFACITLMAAFILMFAEHL